MKTKREKGDGFAFALLDDAYVVLNLTTVFTQLGLWMRLQRGWELQLHPLICLLKRYLFSITSLNDYPSRFLKLSRNSNCNSRSITMCAGCCWPRWENFVMVLGEQFRHSTEVILSKPLLNKGPAERSIHPGNWSPALASSRCLVLCTQVCDD